MGTARYYRNRPTRRCTTWGIPRCCSMSRVLFSVQWPARPRRSSSFQGNILSCHSRRGARLFERRCYQDPVPSRPSAIMRKRLFDSTIQFNCLTRFMHECIWHGYNENINENESLISSFSTCDKNIGQCQRVWKETCFLLESNRYKSD